MTVRSSDARLEGIREQLARAALFLREASSSTDPIDRFRRLMAATYFGRAAVEIMLESATMEVVKIGREVLEARLIPQLPYYNLIERLRIHDFHRFGVVLRDAIVFQGPVSFRGGPGAASLSLTSTGPEARVSGTTEYVARRSLTIAGDRIFDEESGEYLPLLQVVSSFIEALPHAIDDFTTL